MHQNESCAAKGNNYAGYARQRNHNAGLRSMQKASVNIYKTPESFEMLVFAPGRIKEYFHLDVKGDQLRISYLPPAGFPRPDWILREYSRGAFERVFNLDASIDVNNIAAKYVDGVLQVSLPVLPVKEGEQHEIVIS